MAAVQRRWAAAVAVTILAVAASTAQAQVVSPAAAPAPAGGIDSACLTSLLNMSDCLPYVQKGSTTRRPDKPCCPELAGLVDSNPVCLCELLSGAADSYGIAIDYSRALALPGICHVATPPVSTCTALGYNVHLGPSAAPISGSPSPSGEGPHFTEMADPNDNMDDAMMDIINNDALQGAQFEGDDNNQEVDDGSQYFADYEDEQDNAGEPSGSTTTTGKSRNVRGPKKPLEGRFILSDFEEDTGKVLGPHAQKFVSHCGYLVRDRIPINAREWKQKKDAPHISFVSNRDKALVWQDVLQHFALDTNVEALKERVRNWAMKKMATQFQCWKKKLYNTFIRKNLTPDFNTKAYVKLRPFWDEFVL